MVILSLLIMIFSWQLFQTQIGQVVPLQGGLQQVFAHLLEPTVSKSSTEAQHRAMAVAAAELKLLGYLIKDLHIPHVPYQFITATTWVLSISQSILCFTHRQIMWRLIITIFAIRWLFKIFLQNISLHLINWLMCLPSPFFNCLSCEFYPSLATQRCQAWRGIIRIWFTSVNKNVNLSFSS